MLRYHTIPVTPFQQNSSIVWCDETIDGAVIDPGGDLDELLAAARARGVHLKQILHTHAHIDHAGVTGALARQLRLPIVGPHPGDQFWIDGLPEQSRMFGFPPAEAFAPDRWLADGDTVQVGNSTLQVRHCPGHTPGHVVFYSAEAQRAFVGDVLFAGSIGRTPRILEPGLESGHLAAVGFMPNLVKAFSHGLLYDEVVDEFGRSVPGAVIDNEAHEVAIGLSCDGSQAIDDITFIVVYGDDDGHKGRSYLFAAQHLFQAAIGGKQLIVQVVH